MARMNAPPPGRGRPVTDAAKLQRLDVTERLLRDGASRGEIIEELGATFGISVRAADEYIRRARVRLAADAKGTRETERAETVRRLERLSRKAEARGAFAAAVGAERLKAQVTGALAPLELKAEVAHHVGLAAQDAMTYEEAIVELAGIGSLVAHALRTQAIAFTPALADSLRSLVDDAGEIGRLIGYAGRPLLPPAPPRALLPAAPATPIEPGVEADEIDALDGDEEEDRPRLRVVDVRRHVAAR